MEFGNVFGYTGKGIYKGSDVYDATIGLRGRYVKQVGFGSRKGDVYGIVGIANHSISTNPLSSFDENHIGFSFGAGLDLQLKSKVLVGFELRYHVISASQSYDMNTLAPMLKVAYCF